ncbi:MAG: sugar-binding protein [Pseudomonadota bacterium]
MHKVPVVFVASLLVACANAYEVPYAKGQPPTIDGKIDPMLWDAAMWRPIDQVMIGDSPAAEDFSGRFKLLWREDALFLLAELQDDVLIDARPDPLVAYWDDDALEIFVDADGETGPHQNDFRAFAYHVALDNQSVDIAPDGPAVFPDHVESYWQRRNGDDNRIVWEAKIRIATHDGSGRELTGFRQLHNGETIRFMLAYCDADDPNGRQHFMGDQDITPIDGDKNLGYKTSDVFGSITLTKPTAH